MQIARRVPIPSLNHHEIKAMRSDGDTPVQGREASPAIDSRELDELLLLEHRHRLLGGKALREPRSRFYLDKDQDSSTEADEIDLALPNPPVTVEDLESSFAEHLGGELFSPATEREPVWAGSRTPQVLIGGRVRPPFLRGAAASDAFQAR